jgi:hypothetical protein
LERPDPNKVVLETMSQYAQSLASASNPSFQPTYQPSYQGSQQSYQGTGPSSLPLLSNPSAPITTASGAQSNQQLQQLVNILLAQQQSASFSNYPYK